MSADRKEWYFSLAGYTVRVTGKQEELFSEPESLAPFATDCCEWDQEIQCCLVDTVEAPEGDLVFSDPGRRVYSAEGTFVSYIGSVATSLEGAYVRVERQGNRRAAQFRRGGIRGWIPARAVLTALELEHLVTENNGILLHASCICHEGEAILFTAPSGTGKSTQADLWKQYRDAEIINGDRIMVHLTNGNCEVIGVPFSGSSGICKNRTMPLKAIVCLSQAPDNEITELKGIKAFRRIWEGCSMHTWNKDDVTHAADTVEKLICQVPVFHLACRPDETAVQVLEAALRKIEVTLW